MSNLQDRITLYRRIGASDRVYHAEVVRQGEVAYGGRGGKLKTAAKPGKPVPRAKAQRIYADLVMERAMDGYTRQQPEGDASRPAKVKPRPRPTWRHPQFGRFTFDGTEWARTISVPAFRAFKHPRRSTKCTLGFATHAEDEAPSPWMVAVASTVLANQETLVRKVVAALWDDFTGRGPDSGMFWHGDLDAVNATIREDHPGAALRSPDDLLRVIGLPSITARERAFWYDKAIVELSFAALFDEEHGLGCLPTAAASSASAAAATCRCSSNSG